VIVIHRLMKLERERVGREKKKSLYSEYQPPNISIRSFRISPSFNPPFSLLRNLPLAPRLHRNPHHPLTRINPSIRRPRIRFHPQRVSHPGEDRRSPHESGRIIPIHTGGSGVRTVPSRRGSDGERHPIRIGSEVIDGGSVIIPIIIRFRDERRHLMDVLVDTPRRRPRRPISRRRQGRFGSSRAAGGREGGGRVEDDGEFARTDLEDGRYWHLWGAGRSARDGKVRGGVVRVCIMYEGGIKMVCYRIVEEAERYQECRRQGRCGMIVEWDD
jgi:hypothetical protein